MAHIARHGKRWRAQVARGGQRASAVFDTRAEATAWATKEEAAFQATRRGLWPRRTVREMMDRYAREVSPGKAKGRAEGLRFDAFCRDFPELAGKVVSEVTTEDLARWRDARLARVSAGSVQRDFNLYRHAFNIAIKEWRWLGVNPFTGLKAPGENEARTRRVQPAEVRALCRWLGWAPRSPVRTKQQETALAFLLALRTAMRAGEVLSAQWDLQRRVATIQAHKTRRLTGAARLVPLSRAAVRLARSIPPSGFTLTSSSLDALFRKARDSLLIEDLHFHDTRAEALTRLARRVDVMTLARISGHKDLRILLESYYRETAEQIAGRLG